MAETQFKPGAVCCESWCLCCQACCSASSRDKKTENSLGEVPKREHNSPGKGSANGGQLILMNLKDLDISARDREAQGRGRSTDSGMSSGA